MCYHVLTVLLLHSSGSNIYLIGNNIFSLLAVNFLPKCCTIKYYAGKLDKVHVYSFGQVYRLIPLPIPNPISLPIPN